MKFVQYKFGLAMALVFASSFAWSERMDRPLGIRIGERMTLKPYVSLSVTYDSNAESGKNGAEDVIWVINPAINLEYKAENWLLLANAFYHYNGHSKEETRGHRDSHNYGEDLTYRWTDSLPGEKGWSVMLTQKYLHSDQLEDYTDHSGHEYSSSRDEFKFAGAIERRFGAKGLHADLNANYYWLDYDNNNNQNTGYGLYGWERWGLGMEIGYALSKWTDLLLAGSYQRYDSDNRRNNYYRGNSGYGRSSGSSGWTVQVGVGSYATDRISYRLLGGWSTYRYDSGGQASHGFTYTASANWDISQTWKTMLLATSHYQPTEREFGSSQRVDSFSWGITHSMVQGKLHGMFDLAFRREGREHSATEGYDYDLDIITARIGLTYTLNRYLQLFSTLEYRDSICEDDDSKRGDYYAYDRYRVTIGAKLTY